MSDRQIWQHNDWISDLRLCSFSSVHAVQVALSSISVSSLFAYYGISGSLLKKQSLKHKVVQLSLSSLSTSFVPHTCLCDSLAPQDNLYTHTTIKKTAIIFHTLNSTAVMKSIFPWVFFFLLLLVFVRRSLYFHTCRSLPYIFSPSAPLCASINSSLYRSSLPPPHDCLSHSENNPCWQSRWSCSVLIVG